MQFSKRPLTYEEQADLVLTRGMVADRERLLRRLQSVGYYRLCGYWHAFQQPDDSFVPGTNFEQIWTIYNFDRRLRVLVMEGIERVEVAIRSRMMTLNVLRFGPFGHLNPGNFPHRRLGQHEEMLGLLRREADRSKEAFVQHFRSRYDEFPDLPLWAAVEIMSFGTVVTLLNMGDSSIRRETAEGFGVTDTVFASWLLTLNSVRNICAHHSRLWNKEIGMKPKIPKSKHGPEWHEPFSIPNHRVFGVLTILLALQRRVAPRSHWRERLFQLFDSFPTVPAAPMGMPANWRDHALWR